MAEKIRVNEIQLDTLYEITGTYSGATMESIGGAVSVFGSNSLPASPPDAMDKSQGDLSGITDFSFFPKYIWIEQKTGTTTKLLLSNMTVRIV